MTSARALAAVFLLAWACAPAAADDARARKYYYEDIQEPFFAKDPARRGWYVNVRPQSKPSAFEETKPKDAFRVFVIGGSIAGLLAAEEPEWDMGALLQKMIPGRKVEVMNCGMAGYETYREALIEQEILDYQPDLIVFLTGHNEGIASAPIPVWVMRAQERLSRWAAFRGLVKTLHPEAEAGIRRTDELADQRDATFAKNLANNVRQARSRGVPVAVVVPPLNYRAPPENGRSLYDADFLPGWVRFLQKDYEGALKVWSGLVDKPARKDEQPSQRRAFAMSFVARAQEKLGRLDEAGASYEKALDYTRESLCAMNCQRIIRRVAGEEGAFLVEADRMFRARTAPRMPGMETFNDRMHWKTRFNCLMTVEIAKAMRERPELASLPWDQGALESVSAGCAAPGGAAPERARKEDAVRVLSYVLMGLSWPDFQNLSALAVTYLQAVEKDYPEWLADPGSLTKRAVNPQTHVYGYTMASEEVVVPRLYWHIGELRLLEGDPAGAEALFRKALALDPKQRWPGVSLGVARALAGDKKGALQSLRDAALKSGGAGAHKPITESATAAASALALGTPEEIGTADAAYWIAKAQAASASGNKEAGLKALAQAEGLSPQPEERRLIDQYYRQLGAPRLKDDQPEFWLRQAETALAAKRDRDALAALDRARGLSPQPEELRRVGQYYRRLHRDDKFLELSDALATAYPRDAELWLMRAEALLMNGRRDDGAAAVSRAEALAPSAEQRKTIARLQGWLKDGAPSEEPAGTRPSRR